MKKFWNLIDTIGKFIGYGGIILWMIGTYFFTTPIPDIDKMGILSLIILVTWHLEKEDE